MDARTIIEELASMGPIEYAQVRKESAKELGMNVTLLDEAVRDTRKKQKAQEAETLFPEVEPWPEPVLGGELILDIIGILNEHLVLPEHADLPIALWVLLTYAYDEFNVLPILLISSPTKRCGKTTLLELLSKLCHRPLPCSNISTAALYRTVEAFKPTFILDEAETFALSNEDLRGILNSGHTRSNARAIRLEGDTFNVKPYSTWCPKAIACIGKLADTLMDRSIVILLKRKDTQRRVKRLRANSSFIEIQRKCLRWANDNAQYLNLIDGSHWDISSDRAIDNWEVLISIAERCGFQHQAVECGETLSRVAESLCKDELVNLLEDFYIMFERYGDRIRSQEAVEHLLTSEERPWSEISNGRPMTPAKLARMLRELDIAPRPSVFFGYPDGTRGYFREDFEDAFLRYLPDKIARPQGETMESSNVLDLHPCALPETSLKNTFKRLCYEHKVTVQTVLQGMSCAEAERLFGDVMSEEELDNIIYRSAENEAICHENKNL